MNPTTNTTSTTRTSIQRSLSLGNKPINDKPINTKPLNGTTLEQKDFDRTKAFHKKSSQKNSITVTNSSNDGSTSASPPAPSEGASSSTISTAVGKAVRRISSFEKRSARTAHRAPSNGASTSASHSNSSNGTSSPTILTAVGKAVKRISSFERRSARTTHAAPSNGASTSALPSAPSHGASSPTILTAVGKAVRRVSFGRKSERTALPSPVKVDTTQDLDTLRLDLDTLRLDYMNANPGPKTPNKFLDCLKRLAGAGESYKDISINTNYFLPIEKLIIDITTPNTFSDAEKIEALSILQNTMFKSNDFIQNVVISHKDALIDLAIATFNERTQNPAGIFRENEEKNNLIKAIMKTISKAFKEHPKNSNQLQDFWLGDDEGFRLFKTIKIWYQQGPGLQGDKVQEIASFEKILDMLLENTGQLSDPPDLSQINPNDLMTVREAIIAEKNDLNQTFKTKLSIT